MSKEKEDRLLIAQKLEEVARLLKNISDIGNTHQWFDTAQADILLDDVNEWLAMLEIQRKLGPVSGMSIDELKKCCQQIHWTPNAQARVDKKIISIKPIPPQELLKHLENKT